MYDLKATAHRIHGRLVVHISGQLADTCIYADVIDKYPGGNRVYFVDPGAAQVFISERKLSPGPCLEMLVPWYATVHLVDEAHKEVEIFVNEQKELTVPIKEAREYNVYALTGEPQRKAKCFIWPADAVVLAIYSKVFGPASHAECEKYVKENCSKSAAAK
ncbi:MAG: hypothetical protein LAO76_13265 [Acidobacteriia bacterium]|nr:hypothetical protein [Terriglobia bacterium]